MSISEPLLQRSLYAKKKEIFFDGFFWFLMLSAFCHGALACVHVC
jgi:hypothetical protein